jgi:anti-sigma regulatory factor (Ser/Thr protein kinase)
MEQAAPRAEPADAVVTDLCHLRIPSLPEWVGPTVDYLVQRGRHCGAIHPEHDARLTMALHEALTNSVIHGNLGVSSDLKEQGDGAFARAVAARCADPAYAGRLVDVRASYDGEVARWVLTDQGEGFDVQAALARLDGPDLDPLRLSGRGLMMIRAFVDEMRYEDSGRRLVLAVRRGPAEERRAQPRWPLTQPVRVAPVGPGGEPDWASAREALARDISPGGVALLQSRLAASGRVVITIPTGGAPVTVPAEVRHWHDLGGDVVEVGCRFESPLPSAPAGEAGGDEPAAALARLVGRLARQQEPALERRAAVRVAYTEVIGVEAPGQPPGRGFARDLSSAGISFFATAALPLTVVTLTLPGVGQAPIRLRAQVVRCTRLIDGFYDAAAQFLST